MHEPPHVVERPTWLPVASQLKRHFGILLQSVNNDKNVTINIEMRTQEVFWHLSTFMCNSQITQKTCLSACWCDLRSLSSQMSLILRHSVSRVWWSKSQAHALNVILYMFFVNLISFLYFCLCNSAYEKWRGPVPRFCAVTASPFISFRLFIIITPSNVGMPYIVGIGKQTLWRLLHPNLHLKETTICWVV